MRLITLGHNGNILQTSSSASLKGIVDASYTANGANIPIGWQVQVNDTNGGTNNQQKTHNFWANGNVTFSNSVFITDNLSVTGNITGNNITGNLSILANGTSNISIPSANGNIVFSTAGIANVVNIQTTGQMNLMPSTSAINGIVINSIGNPIANDTSRISSFRYRGTMASPLSVQPNDATMRFLTAGHNGSALQTNSIASIRAVVDSSYTANGANIPIGWQMQVNDTNSGTNNQTKTHFFYANGNVSFANSLAVVGNISGANISGANGSFSGALQTANTLTIFIDNNTTQGLFQTVYNNANIQTAQWTSWRYRGNLSNPLPALAGDEVSKFSSIIYGDSGNTYKEVFQQITSVTENDGAGNTAGAYKVLGFGANSTTQFYAKEHQFGNIALNTNATIYGNGSANVANVSIQSNGFVKLASYTAANLTAITGQVGWMAAVSNSGGGGNPNGMIAFWDTTNGRWSYIHDNSAV
jgi:hypothetical protein